MSITAAGAQLLVETLHDLIHIIPEPQRDDEATHAPILKKDDGHIDWSLTAGEIHNRIRGFLPWPGGYAFLRGVRFQIWQARVSNRVIAPGRLFAENGHLFAGCGAGSLELLEIQTENKKRMEPRAFLNGFALQEEETLA